MKESHKLSQDRKTQRRPATGPQKTMLSEMMLSHPLQEIFVTLGQGSILDCLCHYTVLQPLCHSKPKVWFMLYAKTLAVQRSMSHFICV